MLAELFIVISVLVEFFFKNEAPSKAFIAFESHQEE